MLRLVKKQENSCEGAASANAATSAGEGAGRTQAGNSHVLPAAPRSSGATTWEKPERDPVRPGKRQGANARGTRCSLSPSARRRLRVRGPPTGGRALRGGRGGGCPLPPCEGPAGPRRVASVSPPGPATRQIAGRRWVWNLGNIPEGAGEGSPEGSGWECTGGVRPAGLVRGEPASASGVARPAWAGLGAAGVPKPSCALGSGCTGDDPATEGGGGGRPVVLGGRVPHAGSREKRSSDQRWAKPGAAFREQRQAHLPSGFAGAHG